jgi:predicted O-linked N-acetylglucosamine transferase (SPINDLY family)
MQIDPVAYDALVKRAHAIARGFHDRNDQQQAEAWYRRTLSIAPHFPEAWCNLGILLQNRQDAHAAIKAYQECVRLNPKVHEAWINLGTAFEESGRPAAAELCYRHSLSLHDSFVAWRNLSGALREMGRFDDAEVSYRRAAEMRPEDPEIAANHLYTLDANPRTTSQQALDAKLAWYKRFARAEMPPPPPRPAGRKIRVGYVSGDFRIHSCAFAFSAMITDHDRAAFEVYCYNMTVQQDGMTEMLKRTATVWRDVITLSDDMLAAQIRADGIDILVDLSGYTGGQRLPVFTMRPARVQVHALGYLNGTGLPCMDYILSDAVIGQQDQYLEKVVHLPSVFHYQPPDMCPPVGPLPMLARGHVTFGYLGRWSKVSDDTVAAWREIMRQVPTALLYLKDRQFRDPRRKEDARRRFGPGVAERLRFAGATGHHYHLLAHQEIDVGLDPFPINGGVSTLEALWMGVPVICKLGERAHSRAAASIMTAIGARVVPETDEVYVRTAVEYARNPAYLAHVRGTLRDRISRSAVGDSKVYVAAVEAAYKEMVNGKA